MDPTTFGLPADINTNFDRPNLQSSINFLLGRIGQIDRGFVAKGDQWAKSTFLFDTRYPEYEFYGQDTWKLRKNLTVYPKPPNLFSASTHDAYGAMELKAAWRVMTADEMVDASLAGLDQHELITIPSLPNLADWQKFDAARLALGPNLSHKQAADRYRIHSVR